MFAKESHIASKTFFLVIFSVVLMIADSRLGTRNVVRAILSVPLVGIQYLVDWPNRFVKETVTVLKSRSELLRENQMLVAEKLQLKVKVQRLMAVEAENESLRALLHASGSVKGKVLTAHLLSVDTDPFVRQMIVNRGRRDGLFVGQTVLDAYGILGQVVEVQPFSSRILLIDDSRSGVPVQAIRNGVRAIAVGDVAAGGLRLVNVPQTADILPGDMLITSGLGSTYPAGYPLGRVRSVTKNPSQPFASILVDPVAHLDRGSFVLLVWPDPVNAMAAVS